MLKRSTLIEAFSVSRETEYSMDGQLKYSVKILNSLNTTNRSKINCNDLIG